VAAGSGILSWSILFLCRIVEKGVRVSWTCRAETTSFSTSASFVTHHSIGRGTGPARGGFHHHVQGRIVAATSTGIGPGRFPSIGPIGARSVVARAVVAPRSSVHDAVAIVVFDAGTWTESRHLLSSRSTLSQDNSPVQMPRQRCRHWHVCVAELACLGTDLRGRRMLPVSDPSRSTMLEMETRGGCILR